MSERKLFVLEFDAYLCTTFDPCLFAVYISSKCYLQCTTPPRLLLLCASPHFTHNHTSNEGMLHLSLFLWIIITFKVLLRLLLVMMVMMLFDGFMFFYRHRYWQRHFLYDGFRVYVCVMLHGHMYAYL